MDHIQQLLLQTGWSCEDLISKLNEFKQKNELEAKQVVNSNGISHNEDSADIIKDCDVAEPKKNDECEEKMDVDDHEEKKGDLENKEDVKTNGINHNEDESKEDYSKSEKSNGFDEKMELDNDIISKTDDKCEKNNENLFETQKELDNTIPKSSKMDFVPHKICSELFDHTYTLNNKADWTEKDYPKKSYKFKTISKSRRLNFLQKSRKFRKQILKQKKIDRKFLIAQYKSPETVRSQIMEQLQLLRSRRSEYSITVKPSKDKIVSKKRYTGEKWSTIINELMQLAEDQNVEIESNDILQNRCDIMMENNFDKKSDSNLESKSNSAKSITETLKNRIGNLNNEPLPSTSSSFIKSEDDKVMDETEEKPSGLKNIMIVDVRGGCEIIPDNNKLEDEIMEDKQYMIKPTKTNDITKIKGWKNKMFSVSNQNKLKLNNSNSSEAAFSSSNLDGFLEEADLHISFKIPTLESGVSPVKEIKKTEIVPAQTSPKEPDKDLLNLFHPRTLGQKKRILTLKPDGKLKKNAQKPRTLAEKRRLMGNESLSKVFKDIKLLRADSKHFNSSFVLYRGKKLKVVTKNQNDIIAYIKSINKPLCSTFAPKKMKIIKTKPSIFNNIYSPTSTVLRYRPGPLCKKADLQYNNQNWKTTLKRLPKIKLLVVPEFKKPIHPYVEFLMPKYDFEITSDRLEFALTALPPKSKEITCFDFNVPYQNNQQEILLREKNTDRSILNKEEPSKIVEHEEIDNICRDVMDKMINYVEIKESADDVVKNDINTIFLEEDKKIESQNDKRMKKHQRKSNKTSNELKRLSVKVIEVNLEEKEEIKNCQKDFCRLGCVCRSLSTNSSLVLTHCGRVECMFRCNCNYDQSSKGNIRVTLPTGVDLLSEGAVNRLENVAKRNLAKVEKEFTQTVIQANNQTIVVGGCSNRHRRVSKLPRKYDEEQNDYFVENSESYVDLELRHYQLKNSQVSLTKINLDDIVPYCLTHKIYDCQCKCMADYIPSEESDFEMPSDDDEYFPDEASYNKIMDISKKIQFPSISDSCSRVKGIPTDYYLIRNRTKTFIKMRNRKFVRNMNRFWLKHDMDVDPEGRPRTPEQPPIAPTPTNEFIKVTSEKSRRKQELVVRGDGDVAIILPQHDVATKPKKLRPIKPKLPPPTLPNTFTTKDVFMKYKLKENPLFKDAINPEKIHEIKQLETTLKSSSKQFEENSNQITQSIRLFTENLKQVEEASNSVKEDLKKVDENIRLIQEDSKAMKRFKMIFPLIRENSHYFHPSPDIADRFTNMLGKKDDTTFILLQWKTLAYYYQLGKVNVWFSSYYNSPKIIITDLFIQPKHFTNVKNFERSHNKFLLKNEIIRALITGNIPGNNPNDDIQVILELSEMLCYVHGTFKKNHNKDKNGSQKKNSKKDKDKEKKVTTNLLQENKSNKDLSQDTIILQENHCDEPIILNTPINSATNTESISITTITNSTTLTSKSVISANSVKSSITVSKTSTIQNDSVFENIEINEVEPEKEKVPIFNYPTVRKIMYSKYKCQQYNYVSIDKDIENIPPCTIRARLPLIKKSALWRMIKLNSDFSVLSLDKSDYRIKYSDLQKVLKMSDDKQMTIAIRTEQTSTNPRTHKDFGIYASPISSNCVFIGPYLQTEHHDVVLMRYLNRELITTERFNSMKGLPHTNSGVWLQQKRDFAERNVHTIDLTESDHEGGNKSDDDDDEEDENRPILTTRDLEIFENDAANFHYNFQTYIEIDITKMNFQNMSVLYFYTNVKGLGYFMGNQVGKDTVILKYPDSGRALQFKNKTNAIDFLEKELSSSFIEAAGFKIKVTAFGPGKKTTNIFNKNLLNGYYVVNEAGFTNVLEITPAKLRELNMTETKFCRGVSHRAARMVYDQSLEASKHCTGAPFVHTRKSTVALLKWLIEEVEELKAESDRQSVQLTVFHQQRPMLVEHFKEVYLDLAPKADVKLKAKMEELLILNGISMEEPTNSAETSSKQNDVICIDIDRSSSTSPKIDQQDQTKLPIYTKNPDMIITATTTKKEKKINNPETKLPKVSVKDISTLKEKVEEKVEVKKNDVNKSEVNKNGKSKTNKSNKTYKYLFKTTKGKLIEIAPEQYEILKANKMKSATTSNSQDNTFQLGSLTITPKLSKGGLEPLISNLPAAELKNIVIPDNLPPGFVKLTLKNVQKGAETKPNTENT
nr:uncharacterized protein LOC111415779 [Onthophagus taurus]